MEITGLKKYKELSRLSYIAVRRPFTSRAKTTVLNEYEAGWKSYDSILDRCDDLQSWLMLKGIEDQPIVCNVNAKMSYGIYNMPEFNRNSLLQCIEREFGKISSITEFGSGLGRNLLYIKNCFPHIKCYGYELCHNGVEIAKRARDKFGFDVEYSQLDFINDAQEKYVFEKTDIAYTMYALEQIPTQSGIALTHILNQVYQGSIHIEPIVENYPLTLRGIVGRIDHWKVDYVRHFEKQLRTIPHVKFCKKPLYTAHNPLMFPSLYCIKKMG